MATWDYGPGTRNPLPPISQFEPDHHKIDHGKHDTPKPISSLSLSAIVSTTPSSTHSGPPPPYSATAAAEPMPDRSGYISPPESTTRRSTREEDGSFGMPKSLPSIHEALGTRTLMPPALSSTISPTAYSSATNSAPSTAVKSHFSDAPPLTSTQASRYSPPRDTSHATSYPQTSPHSTAPTRPGYPPSDPPPPRANNFDSKALGATPYGYPPSPRTAAAHLPYPPDIASQNVPRPPYQPPASSNLPAQSQSFNPGVDNKADDRRQSFTQPGYIPPYGETVKRHLDIYDADVALHEIHEASTRTLDFSSYWSHRYYQANRSHGTKHATPSLQEIDEMIRHSQHIVENLHRIREIVVLQQTPVPEERARGPNVPDHAHYRTVPDDYKAGGFTGVDAKKRRGKAAPPGRCHSCARAETPEWRRGPDGARTLCNACGLHYAKLTRKLGANQNASGTGPNHHVKSS